MLHFARQWPDRMITRKHRFSCDEDGSLAPAALYDRLVSVCGNLQQNPGERYVVRGREEIGGRIGKQAMTIEH